MQNPLINLIEDLRKHSFETEWIEFKSNDQPPEKIGQTLSALANSACLHQKDEAYMVFGIDDKTHEILGTTFNSGQKAKGNEDLEPWLARNLQPSIDFKIEEFEHESGRLVVFFIPAAKSGPVKFLNEEYIRVGSAIHNLKKYPDKEALIWERRTPFESKIAQENVDEEEIVKKLDFDTYFQLIRRSMPSDSHSIIDILCREKFILKKKGGLHISNLGAIVLARKLSDFPKLENKRVRVVTYDGNNKLKGIKDKIFDSGYAVEFGSLIDYIESQIPSIERIQSALRETTVVYPKESIREFVANALVHQDFSLQGASPLIEIYIDRIEITNPGTPLVEPNRFIDTPPKSRNEKLSDILFRMNICEKRGSGVDRAVLAIELAKMPAPKIEVLDDSLRVTIYSFKELNNLTNEEKANTCYMHSCIQYVINNNQPITNASLCERMGIEQKNKSIASRILADCLDRGWIKLFDRENKSPRHTKYLPAWA